MANFYNDLSVLGKVIFWVGVIVIICSIFTQCIFCEFVPFRIQMNPSFMKQEPSVVSPQIVSQEQPRQPERKVSENTQRVVMPNSTKQLSPMNSFTNTLYDYFEDMEVEEDIEEFNDE